MRSVEVPGKSLSAIASRTMPTPSSSTEPGSESELSTVSVRLRSSGEKSIQPICIAFPLIHDSAGSNTCYIIRSAGTLAGSSTDVELAS